MQAQGVDNEDGRAQTMVTAVEIMFAHSTLGCTGDATSFVALQASGSGGRLRGCRQDVSRLLVIGVIAMGEGISEDVLDSEDAFLSQSSNFEAYLLRVVAIVLDGTDLSACFIRCLRVRSCSSRMSAVGSGVCLTDGKVSLSSRAGAYRRRFCIFNNAMFVLPHSESR